MKFVVSVAALVALVGALVAALSPSDAREQERYERAQARWRVANAKCPPEWFGMRTPVKSTVPPIEEFVIESR
jgi:hypothetical protein